MRQVSVDAAVARAFAGYFAAVRPQIDDAKRDGLLAAGIGAPEDCYETFGTLLRQSKAAGDTEVLLDLPSPSVLSDFLLYTRAAGRWIDELHRGGVIRSVPSERPDALYDRLDSTLPPPTTTRFGVGAQLAPDALLLVDASGRIIDTNVAAIELLGWADATTADARRGTHVAEVFVAALAATTFAGLLRQDHPVVASSLVGQDDGDPTVDVEVSLGSHIARDGLRILSARPNSDRIAREQLLTWQATHDPLCGIPNRRSLLSGLSDALRRADRDGVSFAVLLIDIDDFKSINDRFGHGIGDAVLIECAERICDSVRPADVVARLSGDEFAVLLGDARDRAAVTATAERIRAGFAPAFAVGRALTVTASVGVAFIAGGTSRSITASQALAAADQAMYDAKRDGKNRWAIGAAAP